MDADEYIVVADLGYRFPRCFDYSGLAEYRRQHRFGDIHPIAILSRPGGNSFELYDRKTLAPTMCRAELGGMTCHSGALICSYKKRLYPVVEIGMVSRVLEGVRFAPR
ncbi:hypothetical protein [Nocardia otitidiscaviarum]|uniref:hypothetical protein n=1 Tax=Nocardia otitidiscaviarum TaxID=1823 RepID=UPI001895E520|nr:hypothetical protein [Nocardia otitidiscaviarum]MBF6180038.1 hypothetical protein [Nocardia otitidiscaviarum]